MSNWCTIPIKRVSLNRFDMLRLPDGTPTYYILEGKTPVPVFDLMTWARWIETANRHVKDEMVNECRVSTVFLGIDHGWHGAPLLFETMVFCPSQYHADHEYMQRYGTWDEAEKGHEEIKGMLILNELFREVGKSDVHIESSGKIKLSKAESMVNRLKKHK